jgi:hypothetical protein
MDTIDWYGVAADSASVQDLAPATTRQHDDRAEQTRQEPRRKCFGRKPAAYRAAGAVVRLATVAAA